MDEVKLVREVVVTYRDNSACPTSFYTIEFFSEVNSFKSALKRIVRDGGVFLTINGLATFIPLSSIIRIEDVPKK